MTRDSTFPPERARLWRAAALGVLGLTVLLIVVHAFTIIAAPAANMAGMLSVPVLFAFGLFVAGLVWIVTQGVRRMNDLYLWVVVGCAFVLLVIPPGLGKLGMTLTVLLPVLVASVLGAGISALGRRSGFAVRSAPRWLARGGLLFGMSLLGAGLWWFLWDGPDVPPQPRVEVRGPNPAPDLRDPSQTGPYAVRALHYGSGRDRHRPEFGPNVDLRTRPVDGSRFLGEWDGPAGWARKRYWGFGSTRLPVQGSILCPEGTGPFPLVLVVHGNHAAEDFSDPGYDYLARVLASRGYIVASIDENFLNFSFADLMAFSNERRSEREDVRAWLLLEHLRAWRGWSRQTGNPFCGKVDMSRIALVGHSIGGTAVAVATAMNRLAFDPNDARVALDNGFGIRSVVAIAPAAGGSRNFATTNLDDVNYLTLQGSYDAAVPSFEGARLFQRVRFTDGGDWFKASVYIERADHAQFNSRWGRSDSLGLGNRFLNLRPLLSAADQQRIAVVYVSAFLDATLQGEKAYRAVFKDRRTAAGWLPPVTYVQQYQDSATRLLSTYERDLDVTTTTLPGGRAAGRGLTIWREGPVPMKWGWLGTRAVFLGWDARARGEPAEYRLTLPENGLLVDRNAALVCRLAPAVASAREPLDFTVELVNHAGQSARLPLSHVSRLAPQLPAQLLKTSILSNAPTSEPVFNDYEFPFSEFVAANPHFDPQPLRSVGFVFDLSPAGEIILDDVGFR